MFTYLMMLKLIYLLLDWEPFNWLPSTFTVWNVSKYGVFSSPYFHAFGLNAGKYGSEKTPHLDNYYAVVKLKTLCINSLMIEVYKYLKGHSSDIMNDIFKLRKMSTISETFTSSRQNPCSLKYGLDAISY